MLTSTVRLRAIIKKTSLPLENIRACTTYLLQIQVMFDGDDAVFTGFSIEVYELFFWKVKSSEYVNRCD